MVIAGAGPNIKTSVKDKNLNPVWNEGFDLYERGEVNNNWAPLQRVNLTVNFTPFSLLSA